MVVAARIDIVYPRARRLKQLLRRALGVWLWLLTFRRIEDINSGLRVFERERVLPLFDELSDRFSFTTSLTLLWTFFGWPIVYVPTPYAPRLGESKVRFIRDGLRIVRQSLRLAVRHRKII